MGALLGADVIYVLTKADAEAINRRREDFKAHQHRAPKDVRGLGGRSGHQGHFGNHAAEGQECAAKIVRVFDPKSDTANLQVFLDGNDTFWATSASPGTGPGKYRHAVTQAFEMHRGRSYEGDEE